MLRSAAGCLRVSRRSNSRPMRDIEADSMVQALQSSPANGKSRSRAKLTEKTIRTDADGAFFIKCHFLGKTSRWNTYSATVALRNDLFRVLGNFRRQGIAGEEVYTAAVLFFTQLHMGGRAHRVFNMAIEDGIRPNSRLFNFLLGAYANEGNWDETCRLWVQMVRRDILPTPHSFNLLIRAQQRRGKKKDAFELLSLLTDIMQPNSQTWTILLSAATTYEEATLLLGDMRKQDHLPDNRSVGAILDACVMSGDINNAEDLLRRAEAEWGVPLTTGTFNVLLNLYKEIGDLEGVKECMRRMIASGCRPDTLTYNLLVSMCGLCGDTHSGRAAFVEAESLGMSRTIHMSTAITAVFGYAGDHENLSRCWESRPGRGTTAKRTEPQLANMRECHVASRLLAYDNISEGLMKEFYRLRDIDMTDQSNPFLVQTLVRSSVAIRGWGIKPIWRMVKQVRSPKESALAIDLRRHQKVLHITTDLMIGNAIVLWIVDHCNITEDVLNKIESNPWSPTGITHLDLIEEIFMSAFNRGPSMGAALVGHLLASYAAFGIVNRAMVRFSDLLEGNASVRWMYPHATSMREIYSLSKDQSSVDLCNDVITRYHNQTLWKLPSAEVLQNIAEDGSKPSDQTFSLIREKRNRAQAATRQLQREKDMVIRQIPGEKEGKEDFLIGIVSDQAPFISGKLNAVDQMPMPTGKDTVCTSCLFIS